MTLQQIRDQLSIIRSTAAINPLTLDEAQQRLMHIRELAVDGEAMVDMFGPELQRNIDTLNESANRLGAAALVGIAVADAAVSAAFDGAQPEPQGRVQ